MPKKYLVILIGLFTLCIGIVIWVMWDSEQQTKIDTQVNEAEKSLNKQVKERKKDIKKELGVELPTMEEVQRILEVKVTDSKTDMDVIKEEYGDKWEYIYLAYQTKTLLSSQDNEKQRMAKESKIYQDFNKDAFQGQHFIDSETNNIILSPPYASLDVGFRRLSNGLYGSYVQVSNIDFGDIKGYENSYIVTILYYADNTMTVTDFQKKLDKLKPTMEGNPLKPYMKVLNKEITKIKDQMDSSSPYLKDYVKDLSYFDVFDGNWDTYNPSEMVIYKGTVVTARYIWDSPDYVDLENVNTDYLLHLQLDTKNKFTLYPVTDNFAKLPLKP